MNVENRIKLERRIVRFMCKDLISEGCMISVNAGEEWVLRQSTDINAIMKAVMTTDEDVLLVRDANDNLLGMVWLVYDNDGYDVIGDCSVSLEEHLKATNAYVDKMEEMYA